MKYVIVITQKCNLDCDYCYVGEKNTVMPLETAREIIDFIFKYSPKNDRIDIGFFGGEPLLEFDLIRKITALIHKHTSFNPDRVILSMVTNGTILSKEIIDFLIEKNVGIGISCDGPPFIQDKFRHFPNGKGTSQIVEKNITKALHFFPFMPVNAVYSPENIQFLPDIIDYFSYLGVKNIYLNHNICAKWTKKEANRLPQIYNIISEKYMDFYRQENPKYISLIDSKITAILRGGYKPQEKCRMGSGEFAFTPSGNVYPCERLIGSDDGKVHCIGNINHGFTVEKIKKGFSNAAINLECQTCTLNKYCMNWCGCTNYFSTKKYTMVGPFVCASEKAAIHAAYNILKKMGDEGFNFSEHLTGKPLMRVMSAPKYITGKE